MREPDAWDGLPPVGVDERRAHFLLHRNADQLEPALWAPGLRRWFVLGGPPGGQPPAEVAGRYRWISGIFTHADVLAVHARGEALAARRRAEALGEAQFVVNSLAGSPVPRDGGLLYRQGWDAALAHAEARIRALPTERP